ncbi:MAG: GNAT family N-acetyltransferase [Bacteroidota bacterium]
MEYRLGKAEDLTHIETFVWQAIFPAFEHPDLNEEQRAANDRVVEDAREVAMRAIMRDDRVLYIAYDEERQQLAGMVIGQQRPTAYPTIDYLIVARRYWGKGVADQLLGAVSFWLSNQRPLQLAVRYYNSRAIAFFEKHGFQDTGESAGDYAIPRILMLRPAGYEAQKSGEDEPQLALGLDDTIPQFDQLRLPTNPPEELPNTKAAIPGTTEESPLELQDLFADLETESSNSPGQDFTPAEEEPKQEEVTEVIATAEPTSLSDEQSEETSNSSSRFPHIELEIALPEDNNQGDNPYADHLEEQDDRLVPDAIDASDLPFEFAFQEEEEEEVVESPVWESLVFEEISAKTESLPRQEFACSNCGTLLPAQARFCFNCGEPQPRLIAQPPPLPIQQEAEVEKAPPLEKRPEIVPSTGPDAWGIDWGGSLISDFRSFFRQRFVQRVTDYFGLKAVSVYEGHRQASDFQDTVSAQLSALADFVRLHRQQPGWTNELGQLRLLAAVEALVEFFLVEGAVGLHKGVWPQRLLRHQAKDWNSVDLFAMVMDYLNLAEESEEVYTDFVQMPAKVLRNASKQYLRATKDERVLFVCDQSLLGTGKQGFAMTDVAVYWRPVLQSANSLLYQDIETVVVKGDHLLINGQYFDGGQRLNRKLALLLRRLKTLVATYAA